MNRVQQKIFSHVGILVITISCILIVNIFSVSHMIYAELLPKINKTSKIIDLKIPSLFKIRARENDFELDNGKKIWNNVMFDLNPKNSKIYEEIKPSKKLQEKIVVIYPLFTAAAYDKKGFYDYYKGECDESCLTTHINKNYELKFESSGNAVQVLKLLGYNFVTDVDVDKNPSILSKYGKVIILHNEYVTKKEFDAITSHPNVIYLYPNALYAKVKTDYTKNTITLIRGHGYPKQDISNGFDWKFDNSDLEYNTNCSKMGFDKISQGWMFNCYPEFPIHASKVLLKIMRDL